jgi:hypothetical protein
MLAITLWNGVLEMDETPIAVGRRMLRASICLLVLALPALAMPRVQDKGSTKGSDEHRSSTQSSQSQAAQADVGGATSTAKSNCDQESAVSEFSCAGVGSMGPVIPPGNGSNRVAPGLFGRGSRGLLATQTPAISSFSPASTTYQTLDPPDLRFLSEQANNPLTSLGSFAFETTYLSPPLGVKGWPGQIETLYRSTVPLSILGASSTLHIRLPYAVASTGRSDGGNIEVMDLIGVSNRLGQWGAGAVATLGSIDSFGLNTFQAGPALAFVTRAGRWQLGAVNRNLFSQHAAMSSIQPVIAYQAGRGWSVSAGNIEYKLDWHHKGPMAIPASIQVGKVLEHGSRYYRFSVAPEYNVRGIYGAPRWTVTMGVAILGPHE